MLVALVPPPVDHLGERRVVAGPFERLHVRQRLDRRRLQGRCCREAASLRRFGGRVVAAAAAAAAGGGGFVALRSGGCRGCFGGVVEEATVAGGEGLVDDEVVNVVVL